jgi:HlyD family secretion protein
MTASVTFVYAERTDVLRVPNAALRFRPAPDVIARMRGEKEDGKPGGPGAAGGKPAGATRVQRGAKDDPTQRTVWVVRGDKPESTVLHTGVSDGTLTEVLEGQVSSGDKLVTDVPEKPGAGGPPGGGPRVRMF